jgi:hypothetical protein
MLINFIISADNLAELINQKYIDEAQKTKLEQFNFDLISNLDLDDNLDSEEWKKTGENAKEILKALSANDYKVKLNKTGEYWEAKLIK